MFFRKLAWNKFHHRHENDGHHSIHTHATDLSAGHGFFQAWLRRKSFAMQAARICALGALAGLALPASAAPGDPFPGAGSVIFVSVGVPAGNPAQMQLYTAEQTNPGGNPVFTPQGGPAPYVYNAMGFHPADMYLYAMQQGSRNLLRIGMGGMITPVGTVTFNSGFPADNQIDLYGGLTIGDFGDDTCLYVHPTNDHCTDVLFVKLGTSAAPYTSRMWAIDIVHLNAATITLSMPVPNVGDFAFAQGYLWGVHGNVTAPDPVEIYRITPTTGLVTKWNLPTVNGTGPAAISTAGIIRQSYGAQWRYGNGDLGIAGNATGVAYHIKITNPDGAAPGFQIVSASPAPASLQSDGASYAGEPIDLSINKTASAFTYTPGGALSYTLTVTNGSAFDSSGAMVTDTLPDELLNPATASPGCSIAADGAGHNVLTCVLGALAAHGTVSMTVTGDVAASAHGCFSNTAFVTGNERDQGDPDNDKSTVTVCPLQANPQVSIAKTANVTKVAPGGTIVYEIRAGNPGSVAAANVAVNDPVPAGIASMTWTCAGAACPHASGAGALHETLANLAAGDQVTYTVTATVTSAPPGAITNTASVVVPGGTCVGACESSVQIDPLQPADAASTPIPALSWWALLSLTALLAGWAARLRSY